MGRLQTRKVNLGLLLFLGIIIFSFTLPSFSTHLDIIFINAGVPRIAADAPIIVNNDADWVSVPGISGTGSPIDPFVIKNKDIDAGGTGSGILIGNTTANFVIQDCNVYNSGVYPFSAGIRLVNVSNGLLMRNNCSDNTGAGVDIENNCSHINIVDNNLARNQYGVIIYNIAFNISIINNNVTNSFGGPGIALSTWVINVTIKNNNVSANQFAGISSWLTANVTIQENVIASNINYGIRLYECNTTISTNNTITAQGDGIYLETAATRNQFIGNNLTGNTDAVHIIGGNESIFDNNLISGNTYGIHFVSGNNNTILRNSITGTSLYALYFDQGGHNHSILWNNVSSNQHGIYCFSGADNSKNNTIAFNSFIGNTGWACHLDAGYNGWLFYGNNFSSASNALNAGLYNRWDNGSVGNFWNNYAGADADDDFIGDTPQTIPGFLAYDNYPCCNDSDDVAPTITITTLISGELYGSVAPAYDLDFVEAYQVEDIWVSYDGGTTYHTCGSSGVLPYWGDAGNGTIIVTFYANDTGNNVGHTDITIEKDCAPPTIISTGITAGTSFISAPVFTLVIAEANRDKVWYSLDGGATNHTLATDTGAIDSAVWANLPAGNVIISIWSNDTLGNIASVQVIITKTTGGVTCEGCIDPTTWVLIGAISAGAVVGIGIVVKKRKNRMC